MKVISLVITESVLLAITAAAVVFLISAFAHVAFVKVPLMPVIYGTLVFYALRLIILFMVRNESKVRYKKLRGDDHIKVFNEPPKSTVWKKLLWLLIILIIVFMIYSCVHQLGMQDMGLPINLGSRLDNPQ